MKARTVARELEMQLLRGCGDNSCRFGPKVPRGGMGTNGGCRCHDVIQDVLESFMPDPTPAPSPDLGELAEEIEDLCDQFSWASGDAAKKRRAEMILRVLRSRIGGGE